MELFDNGQTLYSEGNYEAAILAFKESLAISGESLLHFNIASSYELLGKLEQAYDELNLYRAVAPEAEGVTLDRRLTALRVRMEAEARAKAASSPKPLFIPYPVPPEPVQPTALTWTLVGTGASMGLLSGAGLALSTRGLLREPQGGNADAGRTASLRAINALSWVGLGAGAGVALTAIATARPALELGVGGSTVMLQGQF